VNRLLYRLHALVQARRQRQDEGASDAELALCTDEIDFIRRRIAETVRRSLGDREPT
jgi:hypothetical protein